MAAAQAEALLASAKDVVATYGSEMACAVAAVLVFSFLAPVFRKLRILWGLRHMKTAPQSLGVPFFGHTYALARAVWRRPSTWDLFCTWSQGTAPEPARVQIFQEQCACIGDPELMKRVLQTNMKNYAKDTEFSYRPFMGILGTGLVTSEGDVWARQRKVVSSVFRIELLDDIVGISIRAADRLCAKLEKVRGTTSSLELSEEFRHLALQVIGEAILSLSPEESDRVFPKLYLPIMEEANRWSLEPWREYFPSEASKQRRRVEELNEYILGMIRERWADKVAGKEDKNDIVGRILAAWDPKEWGPASEQQLCYEIKTFVLAGHETSAAMMTWMLYELVQHPDCMAKVRAEALAVGLGGPGAAPTREALDKMDYTVASLKETLRLYSVVPVVTRVAVNDDHLGGVFVPAGTRIILSIQGVHHRADLWPEPLAFKPERFAEGASYDTYSFLPFIQGPRNCLGQHLALLEARIVLGTLVKKFAFKCVRGADAGEKHTKMIPIGPAHGMHMTVT